MASFTEQRILQSVTHQVAANTVDVEWQDQVLRDGVVISVTAHRCAYMAQDRERFEADLGSLAAGYLAAAGWA